MLQVHVEHGSTHVHGAALRAGDRPPAAVGRVHRRALEACAPPATHAFTRAEGRVSTASLLAA